jgi:hypothetical protein
MMIIIIIIIIIKIIMIIINSQFCVLKQCACWTGRQNCDGEKSMMKSRKYDGAKSKYRNNEITIVKSRKYHGEKNEIISSFHHRGFVISTFTIELSTFHRRTFDFSLSSFHYFDFSPS